jgi:hypothetical protein
VNTVPENPRSELDFLVGADWDIPLTDAFVTGVQRGVRRRRMLRGAAAGGALVAVTGIATLVISLAGGGGPAPVAPPAATPSASAAFADTPLDGFRIGYLPAGVRAVPPDSWRTCAVSAKPHDCPDPHGGDPTAGTYSRRFDKGVGMWMWITVLRPEATTPTVGRAQITQWLAGWETSGTSPVETFDAPAGPAQVLATVGSEGTLHSVVITTGDGVVISVSGAAGLTITELKKVATNLTPAR